MPEIETRKDTWELITEEDYQKLRAGKSSGSTDDVLVLPEIEDLVSSVSDEAEVIDGALEEVPVSPEEEGEVPAIVDEVSDQEIQKEVVEAVESVSTFPPEEEPDDVELIELVAEAEGDTDEMYLYAEDDDDEELDYSKYYDEDSESEDDHLLDEVQLEIGDTTQAEDPRGFQEEESAFEIDEMEPYVELDGIEIDEGDDSETVVAKPSAVGRQKDDEIVLIGEPSETEADSTSTFGEVEPLDEPIELEEKIYPETEAEHAPRDSFEEVSPLATEEEIVISVEGQLGNLIEVAPLSDDLPEPVKTYAVTTADGEEEGISISVSRLPDEFYEQLDELEIVDESHYRDFALEQIPAGYTMLSRAFEYQGPLQYLSPVDEEVEPITASTDISVEEVPPPEDSETPPFPATAKNEDPLVKMISALIDDGVLEICTIKDLRRSFGGRIEPIEFREGVFQVSEDAVGGGQKQAESDRQLSELVDAVIPEDEDEVMGIDALFSSGANEIDLSLDFLPDEITEDPKGHVDHTQQAETSLIDDGLDFDRYIIGGGLTSLKELKALIRVSRAFNALTAAVLVSGDEGLYIEHGIGLEESDGRRLCISFTSSLYEHVFAKRFFVSVKTKNTGIPALDNVFKNENTRYFNGSLYMPIVFRSEPAYLFLGLKEAEAASVAGLIDKLSTLEK